MDFFGFFSPDNHNINMATTVLKVGEGRYAYSVQANQGT